jgi:hypothetical protein
LLPATKNEIFSHFFLTALLHIGISSFVTQKTSTMLVDRNNMMNHGSRRRTTAAMVPHPRLGDIETLANVISNKAT